jgi:hypothetical protein
MPLGGLAFLPLRLGDGYHASEHNRRSVDLVTLVTILSYRGQNGTSLIDAPTAASASAGLATFTWASHYENELGVSGRWKALVPFATAEYDSGVGHRLFATSWMDSNSTLVCSVQLYDNSSGPPAIAEDGAGTLSLW